MGEPLRKWLRISFINLLIVAALGITLRYKIAFSLPFINQKFLLHGHSHFAFTGWLTQVLMVLMVGHLQRVKGIYIFKAYRWLLYVNLVSAYGMLIFFPIQGYGLGSIAFSTLSIANFYFFSVKYWRDLKSMENKNTSHLWFKSGLIFYAISSIGTFLLAYMMANRVVHQNWFLAALYFFLHFQYNGWFFFASMGLLIAQLESVISSPARMKLIFWLFGASCIPAYLLSVLWMPLPGILYAIVISSAFAQVTAWIIFVLMILKNKQVVSQTFSKNGKYLLLLSSLALTLKLLLQIGSTHPAISQLAYGFRPIVIAYLHLVFLGVITMFVLGYIASMNILNVTKFYYVGIWLFVSGVIINEILLMLQGVSGFEYKIIPYNNEGLLIAAIVMFTGILVFAIHSQQKLIKT